MAKKSSQEGKLIGEITHYFGKIKVAVVKLKGALKEGDKIRIVGGEDTDFEQTVKFSFKSYKSTQPYCKQKLKSNLKKTSRNHF